ncbi:(R,R)-butanediol dehydrogenase / meso-butanediol dehydrogenase / diacetyl reductase/L-iditol 2-dehydrogenase [Quadrisphaera granulorum]|uniref:(R,R)-butanediol dehydrogenase/meso-butanediol dehydrogenase/diacetyl reductase/L-iditol 2-dehydrogenase n=1 Tax=Quadrisphaera granulorum TaxID=317664 RepID=A0A316AW79_9ACTN|nr:alcohol dehydrogenase catalytic domain-containing protein [Quadrisphaera granulorum]PWJ54397.1 (R,R)-butanediol dehydrogenase/meso-butanediol dehydrogenase/diacetyl reductase/L-iditol 2-dehydrogenase [Quadrisphaera granulorum]SZE96169.1 (R,R)-butanediol dehydrogenase / meso-butanediol dehydrogenase / diacetyl reductase/L-iditol 2-dehydrogenase [Quadrisphaera granulorum]
MRTVAVTRIGSLRATDEGDRGRIGVVDLPEHPLGPEDVRIRVAYAAICGSDPHLAEGFFGTDVPIGLGHEVSGVVEALGERATRNGLRVGDRVAGNFLRFCGTCRPCQEGRQQFCEHIQDYNRPGMSETVTWHESQVYRLPESVTLLQGCLLEPVSVAVRIADKTRIRVGDRVAVCGGGPIGQLALQVMSRYGATSLTMIEPIAERRALALRTGAEHVIDPVGEDQGQRALEITQGRGYDVVIDASGSTRAVRGLLDIAAKGATVIYGAMYPTGFELPLDLSEHLYLRELTLTGVFVSPYAFPRALQLLPHLQLEEMTQAVFDLEDAERAFEVHLSGRFPKVVIRCNAVEELV